MRLTNIAFTIIALLLFSNFPVYASNNRVIPEEVVQSWGYQTVSLKKHQMIKSLKKLPGSGEAFYPRFFFKKECFSSHFAALIRKQIIHNKIEATTRYKDYREMLIKQKCLYTVSTNANLFKLKVQPQIIKNLKKVPAD